MRAVNDPSRLRSAAGNLSQLQAAISERSRARMANAFVSFAEMSYGNSGNSPEDKMRVISSIQSKIETCDNIFRVQTPRSDKHGTLKAEIETLIKKILSMVDQTKRDLKMNRWVHEPKDSYEYQYYEMLCGEYQAKAYLKLGMVTSLDLTETRYKMSMTCYKKAHAIYNLLGLKDDSDLVEKNMAVVKSAYALESAAGIDGRSTAPVLLDAARDIYKRKISSDGLTSVQAMQSGVTYAERLKHAHRGIESERLVMKLADGSLRVHGPDHNITISAHELLKAYKKRHVFELSNISILFLALRYESEGCVCVVTGPIANPRQEEDERNFCVASDLVIPSLGCPAICCGLVSASHLNGKLGDVRSFHNTASGLRLAVHFENKSQKSALVRPENLRIAFELPNEE